MSVFQIKVLALLLMAIDHIGLFLFPEIQMLRILGRLSFPLFAFLIANGSLYTTNINKYLMRLLSLGVVSQFPYLALYHFIEPDFWGLNIFFTLSLGLITIILLKTVRNRVILTLLITCITIFSTLIGTSYGAAGVLSVMFFYIYFKDVKKMALSQLIIFFVFYTCPIIFNVLTKNTFYIDFVKLYQPLAILSIVPIAIYNCREGRRLKWFFYLFYPLHLVIIYLIILLRAY